jgi:hypothetical protein
MNRQDEWTSKEGASMGLASLVRHRYLVVGLGALVAFFSAVAVALAYMHITNGVYHGLRSEILGSNSVPYAQTNPSGSQWSSAAVRHYFDDGSWNQQCERYAWGFVDCWGTAWGSAPCHKRYVGGSEGVMARHWVRWDPAVCSGQMHG